MLSGIYEGRAEERRRVRRSRKRTEAKISQPHSEGQGTQTFYTHIQENWTQPRPHSIPTVPFSRGKGSQANFERELCWKHLWYAADALAICMHVCALGDLSEHGSTRRRRSKQPWGHLGRA